MENKEKEIKLVKGASYFFYFLAVLDLAFIIFAIVSMKKAETSGIENAKTILIGSSVAYGIDVLLNIYLAGKGLKEVKGENQKTTHITVALVLFVLQLISIPLIIYSITKGESSWLSLAEAVSSCIVLWEYYSGCKKLKAK